MHYKIGSKLVLVAAVLLLAIPTRASALTANYLYNLSDFEGPVPLNWAPLFLDKEQDEVYACGADGVSIFGRSGMEVYNFGGDDDRLGSVIGGIVEKDGHILLLTSCYKGGKYVNSLMLCNYRGEPVSKLELKGVPPEFDNFVPGRIVYRGGKVYLADLVSMKVIVVDTTGKYLDGYNIGSIMGISEKKVRDSGMTGFNVDKDGNIFYTVAVNFQAYKLTPDRKVSSWGTSGSAPGKFSVVTGIATDDLGNIYVVDTLKAAVIVFDKDFKFLTEFGGRGWGPGDLIAPNAIEIDGEGRAYVSQSANRGVSVYKVDN